MNIARIIGFVIGNLVVEIVGSFICAAIGLWGLSYFAPEIFAFNWEHLLPLWCVMFALRSIFRNLVNVEFDKD